MAGINTDGKHRETSSLFQLHGRYSVFSIRFSIVWYATRDSIVCIILFQEIGVSHLHMSGHAQGDFFFVYLGESPTNYLLGEYVFTFSSRIIQKQLQEFESSFHLRRVGASQPIHVSQLYPGEIKMELRFGTWTQHVGGTEASGHLYHWWIRRWWLVGLTFWQW